jgi:short-subunit dehydrogenase
MGILHSSFEMRIEFEHAVALVTGTSAGIGQEIARELSTRVKTLILVARRKDRLEELAVQLRAEQPGLIVEVEQADLTSETEVDALADRVLSRHGAIDVLINNAGAGVYGWFHEADYQALHKTIALNVISIVHLTRRLAPKMIERRSGAILNVSSGAGYFPMVKLAVYSATKHFVNGFTEALRAELGPHGVVVSLGCPGPVDSEFAAVGSVPRSSGAIVNRVRLSSQKCASDLVAGFERGAAVIFPGFGFRWLIRLGLTLPRWMLRRGLARDAQRALTAGRT